MRREGGTTAAEILIVLLVLGAIVNFWLPNYVGMKKKAQAARVVGDFLAVRDAATMYYSNHGEWPASNAWNEPPAGLEPYLPQDFLWDLRPEMDARYSWDTFMVPVPYQVGSPVALAVSVSSQDNGLLNAIVSVYRGRLFLAQGFEDTRRVIFIVGSEEGAFE
jgi:type II secretory pathway pseudopilin PulG